jgi:hypothetical protein
MNRLIVVAATLTTAAAATLATVASNVPALAASRPAAAHPAGPAKPAVQARTAAERAARTAQAQAPGFSSTTIAGFYANGKYVTVVHCAGQDSPPPVQLGQPGTPLTAKGVGPSAGILAMLKKPNPYKTIYQCTVTVELRAAVKPKKAKPACELATGGSKSGVCATKAVTLNTGFGGMAAQVGSHHPGH